MNRTLSAEGFDSKRQRQATGNGAPLRRRNHTPAVAVGPADPMGAEAAWLLREMTTEVLGRYCDILEPSAPPPANDPDVPRSVFLIARVDSQPIGCAALRPLEKEIAEVRRMYVVPSARRQGVGRRLLAQLEGRAGQFGYRALRLETGNRQQEALALYKAWGFVRIPPFGKYVGDPVSLCFEKKLPDATV